MHQANSKDSSIYSTCFAFHDILGDCKYDENVNRALAVEVVFRSLFDILVSLTGVLLHEYFAAK